MKKGLTKFEFFAIIGVGRCNAIGFGAKVPKLKAEPLFWILGVRRNMGAYGILQDFMNKWNQEHHGPDAVRVFPEVSEGMLLGLKLRFNGARFPIDHATFRGICARVFASSKNQLRVKSGFGDFLAGNLELETRTTHLSFNPLGAKKTLEFLLREVFPDLRSRRNQKLSRWQTLKASALRRLYRLLARLFVDC